MKAPICQVKVVIDERPSRLKARPTITCDSGFWARVSVPGKGHYARQILWHRRPDGLVGIWVNQINFDTGAPTPPRVITDVEIKCSKGHTYKLHPWEVVECAGYSAPPR